MRAAWEKRAYEAEAREIAAPPVGEAERLREALTGLLALEAERAQMVGLRDCTCINWSPATERAYEAGRCPHQVARAALASPAPQPAERCGLPCQQGDHECDRPCVRQEGHDDGRCECKNHTAAAAPAPEVEPDQRD
jgi:hypothetical protein